MVIGRRAIVIVLEAVAFREPGQIEPVPSPALAEMLAVEELIHQSLVSVRSRIVDKSTDFLRARRQADQVKIYTTNEPLFADRRIRCDASRLHLGQNEPINRSPAPSFVL